MNPYLQVVSVLNRSRIPYVIVGGFAVVMHGCSRFTPDLNVMVDLESPHLPDLVSFFIERGLRPRSPEMLHDFLSADSRASWRAEGEWFVHLKDPQAPTFSVEVFVDYPLPFTTIYRDAIHFKLKGQPATICSLKHLIQLKQVADRGQDRIDIDSLILMRSIRKQIESGISEEEVLSQATTPFEEGRISDTYHFQNLSVDERMDWLVQMLGQLGKFCIL